MHTATRRTSPVIARLLAALALVLALAIAPVLADPAPASAAPQATVMAATQRMSAPTLNSTLIGWHAKNTRLTLVCHEYGQSVRGYYSPWLPNGGWDALWYRTADGTWSADVDLDTGSNSPVAPKCSTLSTAPAPAPSGLAAKVDAFVAKYTKKYVDYDGRYGAQCVDLFNFYNRDVVGAGFIGVNSAFQLYSAAPTSKYDKLPASATPRKGDVAVWASTLPGSGGAGHVAIVLSGGGGSIQVFEQNAPRGNASVVRTESTAHLIGYLRPRG